MTGPNLHLNDSIGSLFIGVLFAVMLYGLGCAQTLYYARAYPKDPLTTKGLVALMWTIDTARTILDVAVVWQFTVTSHANPSGLMNLVNTFYAEFFLNSLTVLIVQLYFIHSIWRIMADGRKWFRVPMTIAAIILALLSFSGGCGTVYRASLNHLLTAVFENVTVPASIATVTAVVTDVYITASLCMALSAGRTGFGRTEYFISMLTGYAIRRGFFTALIQALHFLTYIGTLKQNSLYWMIFHFPASKVYVNSLLAVLNVRNYIREGGGTQVYAASGASMHMRPMQNSIGMTSLPPTSHGHIGVSSSPQTRIILTKEVVRDDGRIKGMA